MDFLLQFNPQARRIRHSPTAVAWSWPVRWKLNVDGSSLGNLGLSGGGCVLHDASAQVVSAASIYFCHHNSIFAELHTYIIVCSFVWSGVAWECKLRLILSLLSSGYALTPLPGLGYIMEF